MTTSPKSMSNKKSAHSPSGSILSSENHFRNLDRTLAMRYMQAVREGRIRGETPVTRSLQRSSPVVFRPRMDLYDDPKSACITAVLELPGLKKQDICLRIDGGQLLITGERILHLPSVQESSSLNSVDACILEHKSEHESNTLSPTGRPEVPVQEIKYGKYSRSIPLPLGIQPSQISANLGEGMLTVSWPRRVPRTQESDDHASKTLTPILGSKTPQDSAPFRSPSDLALASAASRLRMDTD